MAEKTIEQQCFECIVKLENEGRSITEAITHFGFDYSLVKKVIKQNNEILADPESKSQSDLDLQKDIVIENNLINYKTEI